MILRRHRDRDRDRDRGPVVTTVEPGPPDARAVIDHALRALPGRRMLTRTEAVEALTEVGVALADEPGADERFEVLFAALDAVAGDALVDRSIVADALLDARLVREGPGCAEVTDGADELLREVAVAPQRAGRDS